MPKPVACSGSVTSVLADPGPLGPSGVGARQAWIVTGPFVTPLFVVSASGSRCLAASWLLWSWGSRCLVVCDGESVGGPTEWQPGSLSWVGPWGAPRGRAGRS